MRDGDSGDVLDSSSTASTTCFIARENHFRMWPLLSWMRTDDEDRNQEFKRCEFLRGEVIFFDFFY